MCHRIDSAALAMTIMLLLTSSSKAFNPPRGLFWGMKYGAIEEKLKSLPKDDQPQLKEMKCAEDLPPGFHLAELNKVKLYDKKAQEARIVFDTTGGLCALQYVFTWDNQEKTNNMFETANKGRDKSWEFHDQLLRALLTKYGQPTSTFPAELKGHDVSSGTKLITEWIDSLSGDKIILAVSRQKTNLVFAHVDRYLVALLYHSPSYTEAKREEVLGGDDI